MKKSKTDRRGSTRPNGGAPAQISERRGRPASVQPGGAGVTTVTLRTKSGRITVLRSTRTGRFTGVKSAKVIDRGAERFAGSLKRLATK